MEKIIHRVAQFIENQRISYNLFDKSIGASNGYIGKQIKLDASIGGDVIQTIISSYPSLNPLWLVTGKGKMLLDETGTSQECSECREKDLIIAGLEGEIKILKELLTGPNRSKRHSA